MTEPSYVVKIKGKDFDCLGEQLVSILNFIYPDVKHGIWYASHVEAVTIPPFILNYTSLSPQRVGPFEEMLTLSKNVDQFLSGVFLLYPTDVGFQLNFKCHTEDEIFRDIGDALLEIRAFDTSYFIISTNDFDLLHKIARANYGIIERNVKKLDS